MTGIFSEMTYTDTAYRPVSHGNALGSLLFDTERVTRDLEALYQAIWQHRCARPEERSEVMQALL